MESWEDERNDLRRSDRAVVATVEEIALGPKLEPYRRHRSCPGCGETGRLRDRLMQVLHGSPDRHFTIGWCPGGKEPTETIEMPGIMGVQKVEGRYDCAGIFKPHLHLTCRYCGRRLLTEVANGHGRTA